MLQSRSEWLGRRESPEVQFLQNSKLAIIHKRSMLRICNRQYLINGVGVCSGFLFRRWESMTSVNKIDSLPQQPPSDHPHCQQKPRPRSGHTVSYEKLELNSEHLSRTTSKTVRRLGSWVSQTVLSFHDLYWYTRLPYFSFPSMFCLDVATCILSCTTQYHIASFVPIQCRVRHLGLSHIECPPATTG
ncbi:hypothetical protein N658DRAFT_188736 [Parathielavia hyrcaniae]|uniref:Uncharacterized protein n=1 Tax=Parathielavia hyrcaniae TaxID=113614 RepID=A0AAN6T5G1_9PEZI|nr:hypothetical protein N658DRAFT_188736 [Parathielavia hyrcaniae]